MKYLDIRIDNKLNWKAHIDNVAFKLLRANAIFYKVRDYVNASILKAIYHALFELHIHYTCIIMGIECMHNQSTLSFINQKYWNFLIKLKLKIAFSKANMSTTN